MTPNFYKSIRASVALIALSTLSACATTSPTQDRLSDFVIDTMDVVSEKSVELGGRALSSAKDFLGIYPSNNGIDTETQHSTKLDDDSVVALMQTENTIIDAGNDILVEAAEPRIVLKKPVKMANEPVAVAQPEITDLGTQTVATADLIHEVAPNQNLWEIAKITTGDANNWHVLADINNLDPNASVFKGQALIIPADMIKPGYTGGKSTIKKDNFQVGSASMAEDGIEIPTETAKPKAAKIAAAKPAPVAKVAPKAIEVAAAKPVATPTVDVKANAKQFKIAPNESLWDFAKRTTGDATNWKIIAAQNNFSESQSKKVRAGQSVYVPNNIVKQISSTVVAKVEAPVKKLPKADATGATLAKVASPAEKLAAPEAVTEVAAVDAAAAAITEGADMTKDGKAIKIVEAKFQAEKGAVPLEAIEPAAEIEQPLDADSGKKIMVSGTYYPKAIYNKADFSSSLLMRVSPGTQLTVSKAVGPWYEVITDKGTGYVHTRDIR